MWKYENMVFLSLHAIGLLQNSHFCSKSYFCMYFRWRKMFAQKCAPQPVAHLGEGGEGGVSVLWYLLLWCGKTSGPLSRVQRVGCTRFRWLILPELSNYAMLSYGCAAAKTADFESHFGPLTVIRFLKKNSQVWINPLWAKIYKKFGTKF